MRSKVLINWSGSGGEMFLIYCFTLNILFFPTSHTNLLHFHFFSGERLIRKKEMDNGKTKESD